MQYIYLFNDLCSVNHDAQFINEALPLDVELPEFWPIW